MFTVLSNINQFSTLLSLFISILGVCSYAAHDPGHTSEKYAVELLHQQHSLDGLPMGHEFYDEESTSAIVKSQIEIMNYFFEHRNENIVVFNEGSFKDLKMTSGKIKKIDHTPQEIADLFKDITFPIQQRNLNEAQSKLLFTMGATKLAFYLGLVKQVKATESKLVYFRLMTKFLGLYLKKRFGQLTAEEVQNFLEGDVFKKMVFGDREKSALREIETFLSSSEFSPEMRLVLVFGAAHQFKTTTPKSKFILREANIKSAKTPFNLDQLEEQESDQKNAKVVSDFLEFFKQNGMNRVQHSPSEGIPTSVVFDSNGQIQSIGYHNLDCAISLQDIGDMD